jgi:hypothetical protein
MITATLNANEVNGLIRVGDDTFGAFWQNGDGKWSVRVEGFSVAVVPTLAAVRAFARSALSG